MIKKKPDIYIHIAFLTFFLILKFILIFFLHVLLVFKIQGIFGKRKRLKGVIFFISTSEKTGTSFYCVNV